MTILRTTCRVHLVIVVTSLAVLSTAALAAPVGAESSVLTTAQPSTLLTIDQNRTTVVDRIVGEWGATLSRSTAGISSAQLHTLLMGLRADHLLAASLAGSVSGLRDVLANSLSSTTEAKSPRLHAQALGDTGDDLVYTPVSPCRLFDTRPAQGGLGVMTSNVRRTYGATAPVANQGGPGGCNAATGAAVALIQIGTLTPSGNGFLQGGPQGVASFPNALILYQAGDQYGTAVAMPLNVANGQFDVQVQFAATDLYGDLLGYFKAPSGTIQPSRILWVAPSGGNYTSVQAAIDAAAAVATANSRWVVRIAPGIYVQPVTLKDFVDVEGSGYFVTTIASSGAGGTLIAGANSELREVLIYNNFNGASPGAIAIAQSGNSVNGMTHLRNVIAATDGPTDNTAVYVTGGTLQIAYSGLVAALSATQTGVETALWGAGATTDVSVFSTLLTVGSGTTKISARRDSGARVGIASSSMSATTVGTPLCFNNFNPSTYTLAACP